MPTLIHHCLKITIVLALTVFLIGPASAAPEKEESPPAGNYVAKVNGKEISRDDMDRKFNLIRQRYASMGVPLDDSKIDEFKENILNSLIDQEVLLQEAVSQGIKIDPETVKAELDDFKNQFETETAFQNQIGEMNYSEAMILSQIEESKTIQKFIEDKIMPTITVTEDEIKAYFDAHPEEFEMPERVHASHILLKLEPNASDASKAETRQEMEKIKAKLDSGEDFAELAAANSDCPSNEKGGDLGFFARGQMVKPFEDAAFALEPGAISDIVETRFGYHIIMSHEKQTAATLSYDDIKERLAEKLKQDKFKDMFPAYIESLKEKYKIEIPGREDSAAAPEKND